ncbi:MAG: hypothetical protein IPJ65_43660 [Archangiaceae bacterium]|nr:hypothetical protein [Archangiaceae bacterium]
MPRALFAVTTALSLLTCRTESLSAVETKDVTAGISALTRGDGSTEVSATFRKGATSLTFLQLTVDDTLTATTGTTTREMSELSLLGVVSYSASFDVDAEGTQFKVSLQRMKDSGAPSSVATLPAAFTVTPLGGSFSRAASGPKVEWSNAGSDPMELSITGDCITQLDAQLPSGAVDYTVAAGALKKRAATTADGGMVQIPDSCTATATVSRNKAGQLDPGYGSGGVVGIQRRTATFTTAP